MLQAGCWPVHRSGNRAVNPAEWLDAKMSHVIVALAHAGAAVESSKEPHGVDTATT